MALSKIPLSLTSGTVPANSVNTDAITDPITLSDAFTIDNPGSETRIVGKAATPISLNYNYNGYVQAAAITYDTGKGARLQAPEDAGFRQNARFWNSNSDNNNTYAAPQGTYDYPINESPWMLIGNFQFRSRRYLHVKIDRVSNSSGPMEQVWAQGYLYNQGVFDAHVGWYSYTGNPINIHTRNNCTSGGIGLYQSSDNKIVIRCDRGTTGYTEGEVSLCWRMNGVRSAGRGGTSGGSHFPKMIESRLTDSSSLY